MFLEENQYQLARKLNRTKFQINFPSSSPEAETGRGGGGGDSGLFIEHNLQSGLNNIRPRGGDSHMKQTGMLVRNFEFNP